MRIQTFKNMKGIIYGDDPKRIGCDKSGVLKVGNAEIGISSEKDEILPPLFHGGTGEYKASFTDSDGAIYDLGTIEVRTGRIAAPPPIAAELMELRVRVDEAESACEAAMQRVHELSQIFDTNSLNFLLG